jgi:hypothetical protein
MKKIQVFVLFAFFINASYSQTQVIVKRIDSTVKVFDSMKLNTDSVSAISANSLTTSSIVCYFDDRKIIYKIKINTRTNSTDSAKLRNTVTGSSVYYFKDHMVIKMAGQVSFNNKVDSGYIYFDNNNFIYNTSSEDTSGGEKLLQIQAMQYYSYFLKRI